MLMEELHAACRVAQSSVLQRDVQWPHRRRVQKFVESAMRRRLHHDEAVGGAGACADHSHHAIVLELLEHLRLCS